MKKIYIILGVFIIGTVIWGGYYQLNGMTTEGYFNIEENTMLAENGKYYLFLEEQKIEVTEDLFKQIRVNHQYHIKYSWNKLGNNKGKIEDIDLDS
ncbi:hypothetical protein [Oceanobacillus chungangensis]|uniref:Uncharacterized protein n=1 Tax=Oceanobacillus chungangensis TaxID=1229152 RepID=A0A3D8PXJ5_9BACI|nr:hypothetical protein [Oceanobacillus chungangensis]RDW20492.1 hypothetical protein CWR45_04440 [Oceanobacillus chungangensis]